MKVLIGLSGGFDSSVSARMLLDLGHTVEGACLVMHEYTDTDSALGIAELFSIPCHIIDAREKFSNTIMENFAREYSLGRTPNPCVICNPTIKFRLLYDYAVSHGFDKIATGHYADLTDYTYKGVTRRTLLRPADVRKDQTYMLYRLPEDILSMLFFPLAGMKKEDLRRLVSESYLSGIDKSDSQEICFLPDGNYPEFVKERVGEIRTGNFVSDEGEIIGAHKGIAYYTIGQRKGLGISLGERAFVTDINAETGDITVSKTPKYSKKVYLTDVVTPAIDLSLVDDDGDSLYLESKVRYAAKPAKSKVTLYKDGHALVEFSTPERSVTCGQSLVFYDDNVLIGGGIIDRVE